MDGQDPRTLFKMPVSRERSGSARRGPIPSGCYLIFADFGKSIDHLQSNDSGAILSAREAGRRTEEEEEEEQQQEEEEK